MFGKLFSYPIVGTVAAQPLIVSGVLVPGQGGRNILFIVTRQNWVYAFDAEGNQSVGGEVIWSVNLGAPGKNGIMGTPVIDLAKQVIYVVAEVGTGTAYEHRLHALRLNNGTAVVQPIKIAGSSTNGVPFVSTRQMQRPGLALSGTKVIIAWGSSDETIHDYYGWVTAYETANVKFGGQFVQSGIFCTTCNAKDPSGVYSPGWQRSTWGGIWQAGRAPVIDDAGNIFLFTGNGLRDARFLAPPGASYADEPHSCKTSDTTLLANDNYFAESLIKLGPGPGLPVIGAYRPPNSSGNHGWCKLDQDDMDLSSSGPTMLRIPGIAGAPAKQALIAGGKDARLYFFDPATNLATKLTTAFGQEDLIAATAPTNSNPSLEPCVGFERKALMHIMGGVVPWQRPTGTLLFHSRENDVVRSFNLNVSVPEAMTISLAKQASPDQLVCDHPGGAITLSANGTTSGTGVLWVSSRRREQTTTPVNHSGAGILRAYNAETMAEMWNSRMNAGDDIGLVSPMTPPTVANGKVYMVSNSGRIMVFGLSNRASKVAPAAIQAIDQLLLQ